MRTLFIDESWDRFDEVLALIYDVLYREFQVDEASDWHPSGGVYVVAVLPDDTIAGVARLMGEPDERERQLRQVAVGRTGRGLGIGRALVTELEHVAARQGASAIFLNARDSAMGFYERLGYSVTGELFMSELTRLPHHPMKKSL